MTPRRKPLRAANGLRVPRHRGTTANVASLYPFPGGDFNSGGPYLGENVTAGGSGWFFDPFELYGRNVSGGPERQVFLKRQRPRGAA